MSNQRTIISSALKGVLNIVGCLSIGAALLSCTALRAQDLVTSPLNTCYRIDPDFKDGIAKQVAIIRKEIEAQREAGKFIAYLSTPLSGKGGGNRDVNVEMARFMKTRVEARYSGRVWVLDPSAFDLPAIGNKHAGGSEYMSMWTAVLAGDNGLGSDFDLFVITGPTDMREYFAQKAPDVTTDIFGALDKWIDIRSSEDSGFKKWISQPAVRKGFMKFYALRASAAFSLGAHDEWNVVALVERNIRENVDLGIPEQIPVVFDGRSLSTAEMETRVSGGTALECHKM